MPTRNNSLTRDQNAFMRRQREDSLKLAALRAQIQIGVHALDDGDFDKVDGADLERYLARLTPRKRARKRAR